LPRQRGRHSGSRLPDSFVTTVRVAKPNTLEPRMVLSRNYKKLEKLCLKSTMDIR
jgi:hypothetical protein